MGKRDENCPISAINEMEDGYVGSTRYNGKRGCGTDKLKTIIFLSKSKTVLLSMPT